MNKIGLLVFFALASLCINGLAQTTTVDSIKTKLALAKSNPEKLALLQILCRHSSIMPADTLKLYAAQALQLAQQQKDETKRWEAQYMYAFSLKQRSLTDSCSLFCDELIKNIKNYDKNFAIYDEALGMKSMCLERQSKIKEASAVVYQMLGSAEKYHDLDGQINAYNLLATVGGQLNWFDNNNASEAYLRQCIVWYRKAISLFKDESFYKKYNKILANLGITYYQLPHSNYDSSLYYTNIAFKYAKEQHQLRIVSSCLSTKGNIFHDQGRFDSAEYYFKQEIALERQIGDPERIAISYSYLGAVYRQRKDFKNALLYDIIERDYRIKNHVPVDPVQYSYFAQDYKSLGNYKAYGEMLDTLVILKDSIYQANSASALAEVQTKYEVQKKENIIIKQKYDITRNRYQLYGITGMLFLLAVLGFILLKYRKQQQQQRIKEIKTENERKTQQAVDAAKEYERKRIIADLHDDIGGGLSTIRMVSDLITQQQEQTEQLNKYALKISSITKDVTERMNTIVWALDAENNTLQNLVEYIREYGMTFFEDSSVIFKSNLPEGTGRLLLNGLQRKNIFLCVKEALNNIYKHSGAKNARININISQHLLTISVHDDGKGLSNENPFGNGLKNIQNRMKEINGEIRFDTDSGGTTIFLTVAIATPDSVF